MLKKRYVKKLDRGYVGIYLDKVCKNQIAVCTARYFLDNYFLPNLLHRKYRYICLY